MSALPCLQAGITNAALASVGVQVMNVLMTVVAASLMDRAGRKQLLTISFRCGCSTCLDGCAYGQSDCLPKAKALRSSCDAPGPGRALVSSQLHRTIEELLVHLQHPVPVYAGSGCRTVTKTCVASSGLYVHFQLLR